MAVEVRVPSAGESVTEGLLSRWLKKDGDIVAVDEPLAELDTEKATTTVPSPAAGRLSVSVAEGETVAIGAVIAQVDESVKAPANGGRESPDSAASGGRESPDSSTAPPGKDHQGADAPRSPQKTAELVLSPAARFNAEERGIAPESLTGTGRGGRIIKEDVLNASPPTPAARTAPAPANTNGTAGRETRQRMSPLRATIARRLVESQQTTASLSTFNEADMSAVMALRAKYKEPFTKKHGVALGFMSFFVKAVCEAAKAFPAVNARLDGNDIVYHHYVNVGVAVSTEKGLMVPVLRDADRMSFAQIEKEIIALAGKARDGKISVSDLQGGTFTITNGGIFGSLLSTPILNPPQSGILGMHSIQKRPVAIDDQVVIRPMMYLALSYDHRLIDGREAVQFLVRVKEAIEAPERLLLEV